ncbi:MAG: ribosomal-protein-alanine N-acetyltransferase [Acidobacteria bacterium]|nr:MAG: ribosomal-protein-alanine N-acetyltransferase [Acidobacteriota bacterium]
MSVPERFAPQEEENESGGHSLEPMHFSDLPEVLVIERACFSDPWPEFAFVQGLSCADCYSRVTRKNGQVSGYLIGYVSSLEIHIANVAVSPAFRRQGVARRLMLDVLEGTNLRCTSAVLDVRESNHPAIRLYLSLGFRPIGRRPRYYRHPVEDAIVMTTKCRTPRKNARERD